MNLTDLASRYVSGSCESVWPNRDPIEESGGLNLYEFGKNNPIGYFDSNGLVVYLETHQALPPIPGQHSYLVLIVDCNSKFYNDSNFKGEAGVDHYATLGAGPKGNWFGALYLTSGINRDRDFPRNGAEYSAALDDELDNDDPLIQQLLQAFGSFPNQTYLYAFLPDPWEDYYNSNGFINGLLSAVGINAEQPPSTPGWNEPVPAGAFH